MYGLDQVNQYLPTTHVLNSITYAFSGKDIMDNSMSLGGATLGSASIIPIGKVGGSAVRGVGNIAKIPVGRSGNILNVITKNVPTTINGTKFTGHALDQMQARGVLSPNAVLDVVKNPTSILEGNTPGTTVFIRNT
ncbi:MAG: hypothetical protein ACTIKE_15275 [Sphingobacterium sp.]